MKIKVWTWTYDGDNIGIDTEVFATEDAAYDAVRSALDGHANIPDSNEEISQYWCEVMDGVCSVQSHEIDLELPTPPNERKSYVIIGTSRFVSRDKAASYYRDQYPPEDGYAAVTRKEAAGEIHIGPPDLREGERLVLLDNGRRYGVASPQ